MGLGMIGFTDALTELKPDLIVVLGDRYEIFTAVAAAMIFRTPVAHLHGGEATEGLIDESIRHSITKMSHLHFVAAEEYRKRVIQLGEQPDNVFLVGGLGIDNIVKLNLLERKDFEKSIDFKLGIKNLLITFHPVTLEKNTSEKQMNEILMALKELKNTHLIFTMPNADTDGRIIFKMIKDFVNNHPYAKSFTSLGQLRYLSCIKHVDGVIGNSSSGLAEVPTFKKGTINIGDRQRGRIKAESVIDCKPTTKSVSDAIKKLYSSEFQQKLKTVKNPYGSGGASEAIVKTLENISLKTILKKKFYNMANS
jgi:GDP/UDP-N,N'-diacetylbacillosamine 2-epimerase (hydrolysing)